jgi:hypothetical protein
MIKTADAEEQKKKSAGVKRVREWLEELLPIEERDEDDGGQAPPGKETSVIVNQLACIEAGCPDVETVRPPSRCARCAEGPAGPLLPRSRVVPPIS